MSAVTRRRDGTDYEAAAREMGVDLAWALREFPVPVYFRGSGRVAILRWSHESVGSHLIVARSAATLAARAQAVIESRKGDVQFHWGCTAELVGPSPQMSARYALDALETQARLFWSHVGSWLNTDPSGDMPPVAVACPYEPEEGSGLDAEVDLEHYSCALCDSTRLVPSVPLVPLYVSLRDRYEASIERLVSASDEHRRPFRGAPSRAAPADDAEPVWGAFADHGVGARGSFLAPADEAWDSLTRALFFYRRPEPMDVVPLNFRAEHHDAALKSRAHAEASEGLERREAAQRAHHAELRALLRSVQLP